MCLLDQSRCVRSRLRGLQKAFKLFEPDDIYSAEQDRGCTASVYELLSCFYELAAGVTAAADTQLFIFAGNFGFHLQIHEKQLPSRTKK